MLKYILIIINKGDSVVKDTKIVIKLTKNDYNKLMRDASLHNESLSAYTKNIILKYLNEGSDNHE